MDDLSEGEVVRIPHAADQGGESGRTSAAAIWFTTSLDSFLMGLGPTGSYSMLDPLSRSASSCMSSAAHANHDRRKMKKALVPTKYNKQLVDGGLKNGGLHLVTS